jgi:hypothetical protein
MNADREFLFSYHFAGKTWGTSVFADSEAEAKEKIKAVGMARYDGELMMRIPAALPGAGGLTRLITWFQNRSTR